MDKLLGAVYELVRNQNPNKIDSLILQIRTCKVEDATRLKYFFSTDPANDALDTVIQHWQRVGCSTDEMVGIVKGLSHGYLSEKSNEKVELVWTGPDLNFVPVRRSEQLLLELVDTAKSSLFLVSFVVVNIPRVEDAIRRAIDRGVDVRMLVESEDREGSGNFRNTIDRLSSDIPGLTLYVWPREKRESTNGIFARVHAKCIVADQSSAFLTSANLTSAALDKNIEIGVNIKGGSVPPSIYQQLISMIRSNEIVHYVTNRYVHEPVSTPAIPVASLTDDLVAGEEILVSFENSTLGVEEQRVFVVLDNIDQRPRQNSLVLIRYEHRWLIGKYAWSKQQDTNAVRIFYFVTVRGFGPEESFEVEEHNWESFMPRAVELRA